MSHQPKVASNINNLKLKKDEINNNNNPIYPNNNRDGVYFQNSTITNPYAINSSTTFNSNVSLNYNNNQNFLSSENNENNTFVNLKNLNTYFDKKCTEEESFFYINSVFTFGSNEMGQIGSDFDAQDLNCFSPIPIYLSCLTNKRIISISAGDGHSICVGKDGTVYAWGASACGKILFLIRS